MKTAWGDKRKPRCDHRLLAAALLLAVLLSGQGITTLTRGWLNAVPFHDHLCLCAGHDRPARHIHDGDELSRAGYALVPIEPPPLPDRTEATAADGRVVSLFSPAANQFPWSGLATLAALGMALALPLAVVRTRLRAAGFLRLAGCVLAPPLPPPQIA